MRLALPLVACALALATPLSSQGSRYKFLMTSGDDHLRGTVTWLGDRGRIDIEGERDGRWPADYLLLHDGGRTIVSVHPEEHTYAVAGDTLFERIVGRALEAVEAIVRLDLSGVRIEGESLGPGEPLDGHATERYRLTQEFTVRIDVPVIDDPRIRQRVVTEYWVAKDVRLIRNPLLELLATVETSLAQQDASFVRRTKAARAALFTGTPLKIVVHSTTEESSDETDVDSDTRTIEITAIERANVDPARFEIPSGYELSHDFEWKPVGGRKKRI